MKMKFLKLILMGSIVLIILMFNTASAAPSNNWHFDGRNWYYVDPATGQRLIGHHRINQVDYLFDQNGYQVLPYKVNYQYQLTKNQGTNQEAKNKYIILHDVGSSSSALDTAKLMKKTADTREAYSNFIVGDGGKVYQIKAPGTVSWGAGVVANENSPVQIELARTRNPIKFVKDYVTYIRLARDMAGKYDIPLTLDKGGKETSGIKSHVWVTKHIWGTHKDPYEYLIRFGILRPTLAWNLRYGI